MIRMILSIFVIIIIAFTIAKVVGYIERTDKKIILQNIMKIVLFWRSIPLLKWQVISKIVRFFLKK
jgi:hypothetical protein